MPVSAAVARPDVMAAWGRSTGEAIHTSTFLGHPVAAAAALATLDVLEELDAPSLARAFEAAARARFGARVRGRGAMLGLETSASAPRVSGRLLRQGFLVLPGGVDNDILSLTPPLTLTDAQRDAAFDAIEEALDALESEGDSEAPGAREARHD